MLFQSFYADDAFIAARGIATRHFPDPDHIGQGRCSVGRLDRGKNREPCHDSSRNAQNAEPPLASHLRLLSMRKWKRPSSLHWLHPMYWTKVPLF